MTAHQHLRKLAEAATPGPWELAGGNEWLDPLGIDVGAEDESSRPTLRSRDAQFIAATDPQTVLALLDEIHALRQGQGRAPRTETPA